jgi:dTDP-4-amino-4,6-dideoxygalactose transaminase
MSLQQDALSNSQFETLELRSSVPPKIPFNKPFITGKEIEYIASAISGGGIAADGHFTRRCADFLSDRFSIHKVLMTPSCTAALELGAMLCDLKPGDEVIMPSFTFVSTANAVARAGARPVFVDIRPDTLNIDERLIEKSITEKTRAIFPVHYAGVSCDMDSIMEIARKHSLLVVEDAAQGVNATYNGRALGSIGHLGAYSFHDTKNYVCGEGGALCVNSPELAERAEILREKGTNRSKFFRGEIDKYSWVDVGSSYVPAEILCAFLQAQLEAMDEITARRRAVHQFYLENLAHLEERELITIPRTPAGCETNFHMFYVLLPDAGIRDGLMAHLKQNGISAVFHYVPLHTSNVGKKLGYSDGDLPLTEDLSARLLRLPFYPDITRDEQMRVVTSLSEFLVHTQAATPGRQQL